MRKWAQAMVGLWTAAFFCVPTAAYADGTDVRPSWNLRTLTSTHRFIPDEPRADPDQPSLRYAIDGGRWKAMSGGSIMLIGAESDTLRVGLSLAGFLELINITPDQPVPWQSYRANVGADVVVESPRLSRVLLPWGGRMFITIGWFHESDHAAALSTYEAQYLAPRGIDWFFPHVDNANFSAYEYVKIRAAYRQLLWGGRLITSVALGTRLFPEPINPGSIRELHAAFIVESRVRVRIRPSVHPYLSVYYELIDNDFVAQRHGFQFGQDRTPLRYAIVNVGVDLVGSSGTIMSPYVAYSHSHGRGIDFPRFYGSEIGGGLMWLL
jgi:hypothetical protein